MAPCCGLSVLEQASGLIKITEHTLDHAIMNLRLNLRHLRLA